MKTSRLFLQLLQEDLSLKRDLTKVTEVTMVEGEKDIMLLFYSTDGDFFSPYTMGRLNKIQQQIKIKDRAQKLTRILQWFYPENHPPMIIL